MSAAEPVDTHTYPLAHEAIEDWQRLTPSEKTGNAEAVTSPNADETRTTAGFADLGTIGGVDYGLWEMSVGAMRDVEGDEVFLVLSGTGRIEFDDPAREPVVLAPGALVRLEDGMKTRWYVDDEPLRKLYIAPSEG